MRTKVMKVFLLGHDRLSVQRLCAYQVFRALIWRFWFCFIFVFSRYVVLHRTGLSDSFHVVISKCEETAMTNCQWSLIFQNIWMRKFRARGYLVSLKFVNFDILWRQLIPESVTVCIHNQCEAHGVMTPGFSYKCWYRISTRDFLLRLSCFSCSLVSRRKCFIINGDGKIRKCQCEFW